MLTPRQVQSGLPSQQRMVNLWTDILVMSVNRSLPTRWSTTCNGEIGHNYLMMSYSRSSLRWRGTFISSGSEHEDESRRNDE